MNDICARGCFIFAIGTLLIAGVTTHVRLMEVAVYNQLDRKQEMHITVEPTKNPRTLLYPGQAGARTDQAGAKPPPVLPPTRSKWTRQCKWCVRISVCSIKMFWGPCMPILKLWFVGFPVGGWPLVARFRIVLLTRLFGIHFMVLVCI